MSDPVAEVAPVAVDADVIREVLEDLEEEEVVVDHVYLCRKCRKPLFTQSEIVPHDNSKQARGIKQFKGTGQRYHQHLQQLNDPSEPKCTSYFLDPDVSPWVASESRTLHAQALAASGSHVDDGEAAAAPAVVVDPDTIYCFHCKTKVGGQSWIGAQCSCGPWITPSFRIHAKAVDQTPVMGTRTKEVVDME